jgi:hypothetical protein
MRQACVACAGRLGERKRCPLFIVGLQGSANAIPKLFVAIGGALSSSVINLVKLRMEGYWGRTTHL